MGGSFGASGYTLSLSMGSLSVGDWVSESNATAAAATAADAMIAGLTQLRDAHWIDAATRMVVVEFYSFSVSRRVLTYANFNTQVPPPSPEG